VPLSETAVEEIRSWGIRSGPVLPARERDGERLLDPCVHPSTLRSWQNRMRPYVSFDWTWLTCRHTFASWHVQGGTPIADVATWCGHSIMVCWNFYASLIPGYDPKIEAGFAALNARRRKGKAS